MGRRNEVYLFMSFVLFSKEVSSKQKTLLSWFSKQSGSDTNSMVGSQQNSAKVGSHRNKEDKEESVAKRPKIDEQEMNLAQ